jgi:hypothetical protein
MAAILFMLGVVVAVAGLVTLGFGIPINEFTLGTTLIIAGTTAFTGGLILLGLSAAVTELGRIAEGLRHRAVRPAARLSESAEPVSPPAPGMAPAATAMAVAAASRIPQPNIPLPPRPLPDIPSREAARAAEAYPAAPSAVEVSAAAIERLRSSIPRTERVRGNPPGGAETEGVPLSPNGAHATGMQHQARERRNETVETAPSEGRTTSEDRSGGAAVEALKTSRLDFLFRSRPARPQAQSENPETLWPAEASGSTTPAPSGPESRTDQMERGTSALTADPRQESAASDGPRSAAILKSGVVDGMAYTLYADGSIEAKLPHGTVRFGSIAELRAHIESNS